MIAMTPMTMNGSMNWRGREPKRAAYNSSFDAAFQRHAAPMAFDGKRALARGKQVLELEAEAVRLLADALDGPAFLRACELLLACTGRVVVTGMGKAGLVGQKISATLASTGTPSLFLHPGEALHGDLGRVRPEDVVLALSKSGGTREVVQLQFEKRAGREVTAADLMLADDNIRKTARRLGLLSGDSPPLSSSAKALRRMAMKRFIIRYEPIMMHVT